MIHASDTNAGLVLYRSPAHQLGSLASRICGWKAFHQHLAALLSGTKQLSTEQFLEKLAEHPELESRQLQVREFREFE